MYLLIIDKPGDEVIYYGCNILQDRNWHIILYTKANIPPQFYQSMSFLAIEKVTITKSRQTVQRYITKRKWHGIFTTPTTHHFYPQNRSGPSHRLDMFAKKEAYKFYVNGKLNKTEFDEMTKLLKGKEHFPMIPAPRTPPTIPTIAHQIWIGSSDTMESYRKRFINDTKRYAKAAGFKYKLWTNKDWTPEQFPLTWEAMQTALKVGKQHKISRWAQVADLARYEILNRYGGVYTDTLIETSPQFWTTIKSLINQHHRLISANEDPCGLNCHAHLKRYLPRHSYLSNQFIASMPRNIVLLRMLNAIYHKEIDFQNDRINQTTGPYFFRSAIRSKKEIHLIDTELIFPYNKWRSNYRRESEDKCIDPKTGPVRNCLKTHYPNALAIQHFDLGGTWIPKKFRKIDHGLKPLKATARPS